MTDSEPTQKLQTLADHQGFLQQVLTSAQERVLIVSQFISISAIESDSISMLVRQAVDRGVLVQVVIDSDRNCYTDGTMRICAMEGIAELVEAGAQVAVANGINIKTLAQDNELIAIGCFNWLSALRIRNGESQIEESTLVYSGEVAKNKISQELDKIKSVGYEMASHQKSGGLEVTRAGKIFGLCFILVIPGLIGNDLGYRNVGFVCTAFMLASLAAIYWLRLNDTCTETHCLR